MMIGEWMKKVGVSPVILGFHASNSEIPLRNSAAFAALR
jgi:hypothetical protein